MNNQKYRDIISFTLPCLAELFLFSLISVVNTIMVGRLGAAALSSVGLSNQPVRISIALFQAFNIGATAMVARYTGAGDYDKARKVIVQTMGLSVVTGLFISIPFFIFAPQIVQLMGAKADTAGPALVYMRFMAAGTLFQVIPLAVSSLMRGAGDSKYPMYINILANVINVILGYIFIYGPGPFPAWGVFGAGLAATSAKVISSVLAILLLFRTPLPVVLKGKTSLKPDRKILAGIWGIGSSAAAEQVVTRGGFLLYTRMISELGTIPFAAHQVLLTVSNLSTNLGQALGMASSSFTGRHLGARREDLAESYTKTLINIALVLSVAVSLVFLFLGRELSSVFTTDKAVLTLLVPMMVLLAIINPAQNTQLVYSGAIKGAGDTRWPLFVSLVGLIFVRLPLVYLFIRHLGWGVSGAWIATAADKFIGYFLLNLRFRKGSWKGVKIG